MDEQHVPKMQHFATRLLQLEQELVRLPPPEPPAPWRSRLTAEDQIVETGKQVNALSAVFKADPANPETHSKLVGAGGAAPACARAPSTEPAVVQSHQFRVALQTAASGGRGGALCPRRRRSCATAGRGA